MRKLLFGAALAAAAVGTPAWAQHEWTERVPHADLRLDRPGDVAKLDGRIARAVAEVCGAASDFDLRGKNDVRRCRIQTTASVAPQRLRAIKEANTMQVADSGAR